MSVLALVDNVTCLGCGCACDDIGIVVLRGRRIVQVRNGCALGKQWFGEGQTSVECRVEGRDASLDSAITYAAQALGAAARPLVYLAPGLSCEAQRRGTALADLLHGRLDSVTSSTASRFILAGQERGYVSATLGEIRNRADVVVFWGIDLERRYPRFASRYAPDPVGMHIELGRQPRTVLAVDIGSAASTADAGRRVNITPEEELATLGALEAIVRAPDERASSFATLAGPAWSTARELAPGLLSARYVALVYDAEPDDRAARSPQRFDRLAALAQALNGRTRCAAVGLRAGGNRSGADSVLVAQTGYPFAVDFEHGYPRYDPYDGTAIALIRDGGVDVAIVMGDAASLPIDVVRALGSVRCIVVGPRATQSALGRVAVAIDTGVDGIHAGGTAVRTDEVPLPLRVSIPIDPNASDVAQSITAAVQRLQSARPTVGDDVGSATQRV